MEFESKQEKDLFDHLVKTAMKTEEITKKAAELRIEALLKSKVMHRLGNPKDESFQIGIDVAMSIPQIGIEED